MPRPTTPSAYTSFLGLSDWNPSKIGENQAQALQNLYVMNEQRELQRRGGTAPLAPAGDANALDGLFLARIQGTDYLLASHNGNIEDWLNGAAIVSGGTGRLTSGTPAGGAFLPSEFNQAIYLGDGTKQNQRFDGTSVKQVMCEKPAGVPSIVQSGSGPLNGTYSYRVTFLSSDGQDSQASDATGTLPATNNNIQLTAIPTSTDPDTTGRRIWRSVNGGASWYLIHTIADNVTTSYLDTTGDASVDTSNAIDLNKVRFPPCQILASHQLRLCGILCNTAEGDNHTLYVSDQLEPWYCPEVVLLSSVDDPVQGARINLPEVPVGLVTYGNVLIVAFQRSMWRLVGDNPNNWSFDKWQEIGCVSHRTMRQYRTNLIWLASDGVYMVAPVVQGYQGSLAAVSRISNELKNTLDSISAADFAKAHAFVWFDRYYLCFPTRAFYYDFKSQLWGELTAWQWSHSTVSENSGTSKELIYAGANGAGRVWQLETGTDDNGSAIACKWRSREKDLGQFGRQKRFHRVVCRFGVASGTATVNLYRGAGELIQTFTQDVSSPIRPGGTVSELDDRCTDGARDEFFGLEVLHSSLSSDFRILDVGGHYTVCT